MGVLALPCYCMPYITLHVTLDAELWAALWPGIGAATEGLIAAALQQHNGGARYSFRAAFQRQRAHEPPPWGSLPAPDSHPARLEEAHTAPDSHRDCEHKEEPYTAADSGTSIGPEGLRSRSRGGEHGVGQQPSESPATPAPAGGHVRVLTLAGADASWPLVEAAKLRSQRQRQPAGGGPVSAADAGLCSGAAGLSAAATPGARLMSGLVAVAGPDAALEPHLVLVRLTPGGWSMPAPARVCVCP